MDTIWEHRRYLGIPAALLTVAAIGLGVTAFRWLAVLSTAVVQGFGLLCLFRPETANAILHREDRSQFDPADDLPPKAAAIVELVGWTILLGGLVYGTVVYLT